MKALALVLLLAGTPALAADRAVAVRIYSLHKLKAINLETDGAVSAGGKAFSGRARAVVRGQLVALEGAAHAGPAKSIKLSVSGGLWFSGPGLPRRRHTGEIVISQDKGRLKIIDTVPMETYIAGVVSGEAQDLSQPEAYKAQAVAARTYTVKRIHAHSAEGYNLCDSTHCQLYTGTGAVSDKARKAAQDTRGELLTYLGQPAATFYHSICGGRTERMTSVWPFEHKPYLVSVRDGPPAGRPYCSIAPGFRWKTRIYFTGLTRLARQAGWLRQDETADGLRVTARGRSGRAEYVEITAGGRKVNVPATEFYHGIGRRAGWNAVKSSYFKVLQGRDFVLLDGVGYGHGVGMCQWGAEGMARKGYGYRDILKHYYPGTEIKND